jgi:hypothetical protein
VSSVHLFLGPTLPADAALALIPGATVHPPVAHGDLFRTGAEPGDIVVIVDGRYHHVAPVRHKEIVALLARDVVVVGCSSMGALRAAELEPLGMVGNGTVFRMYRDGVLEADDEVALRHGEAPDYQKFGEPLVNIRHAAAAGADAGALAPDDAAAIVSAAAGLHYTARSWRALEAVAGPGVRRLLDYLATHPQHADIKAADAIDTLRRLDEIAAGTPAKTWLSTPGWRNHYLTEWQAGFAGPWVAGIQLRNELLIRYQQIYHREFPALWRRFVLSKVGAGAGPGLVDGALAVAERQGVSADTLTDEQIDGWVTIAERAALTPAEVLALVLVRSYRTARRTHDLLADQPDLVTAPDARSAVAEAVAINAEVASWRPGQSTAHIKRDAVRAHLAGIWQLGTADEEGLTAAARDRGFASLADAIEAARSFYLPSVFRSMEAEEHRVEEVAAGG